MTDTYRSASDQIFVGESDPDFDSKAGPREKAAVAAAQRSLNQTEEERQKLYAEVGVQTKIRAKYKIEVEFIEPTMTRLGPNLVGIQFYESGKRLSGGGDERLFICRSSKNDEGCGNIIPQDNVKGNVAFCEHCKKGINTALLTDQLVGRPSTRTLAQSLVNFFRKLSNNADIYVKRHKETPGGAATLFGEKLKVREIGSETVKKKLDLSIYPLANILADTAHGAELEKRFFAFLTS